MYHLCQLTKVCIDLENQPCQENNLGLKIERNPINQPFKKAFKGNDKSIDTPISELSWTRHEQLHR